MVNRKAKDEDENTPKKEATGGLLEKLVPILLLASIVLAFVVGVLWQKVSSLEKTPSPAQNNTTTADPNQELPAVALDQVKDSFDKAVIKFGDNKKKLIFIEAADPSCPYCHIAAGLNPELNKQASSAQADFTLVQDGGTYVAPVPEMKKLVKDGKASFAYLYSPGHGSGEMGALAMYCSFEKGKFWEVHDKLMTAEGYTLLNSKVKNDRTKVQELADFLKSAINPNDIKSCIESGKYDDRLAAETQMVKDLGIRGTPGFYVNENIFRGAYSYKDMEALISKSL